MNLNHEKMRVESESKPTNQVSCKSGQMLLVNKRGGQFEKRNMLVGAVGELWIQFIFYGSGCDISFEWIRTQDPDLKSLYTPNKF